MTIKVTDVDPYPAQASGETITVEINGKTYKVENWATENSSGTEYYDEDGDTLALDDMPEELEEWESSEDDQISEFYRRWAAEVDPLVNKIKQEVFG